MEKKWNKAPPLNRIIDSAIDRRKLFLGELTFTTRDRIIPNHVAILEDARDGL